MQKSSTLMCACLIALIGAILYQPLATALAATAPTVGPFAPADLTIGRSRVLFAAFEQYAQDNDERFPPMGSAAAFDTALAPYVRDPSGAIYLSADTGKPFQPNAALSGLTLFQLNDSGTVVLFQDSAPGQPTIATFSDGHTENNGVEAGDPTLISVSRARLLAVGIAQYTQDYDETLPPMQTPSAFQTAVLPYVRSQRAFTDNLTNLPFVPNAALSGLPYNSIPGDPYTVPTIASAQAAPDGYQTLAYLDGHATHGPASPTPLADIINIRHLLLGVIQYTQDNDGYPPLQSEATFEAAVLPYVRSRRYFLNPVTGQPYLLNAVLSGASLASIEDPAATWLIKDSVPNPDGSLNVGYADGHVRQIDDFVSNTLAVGPDNLTHLVWTKADGTTAFTTLSPTGSIEGTAVNPAAGEDVAGYGIAPDGTQRLLFKTAPSLQTFVGAEALEALNAAASVLNTSGDGPYDGWIPGPLAVTPADRTLLLWSRYDGTRALRLLTPDGQPVSTFLFTLPAEWTAAGMASAPDGTAQLLFTQGDTAEVVKTLATGRTNAIRRFQDSGFTAVGLSVGPDGLTRLLWAAPDGRAELWTVTANGYRLRLVSLAAEAGWTPLGVSVGPDGNARLLSRDVSGDARVRFLSPAGAPLGVQDYAPPP